MAPYVLMEMYFIDHNGDKCLSMVEKTGIIHFNLLAWFLSIYLDYIVKTLVFSNYSRCLYILKAN